MPEHLVARPRMAKRKGLAAGAITLFTVLVLALVQPDYVASSIPQSALLTAATKPAPVFSESRFKYQIDTTDETLDNYNEPQNKLPQSSEKHSDQTVDQQQISLASQNFEAAFQGECGNEGPNKTSGNNPCEHICLDLHDGTYECACFYGFALSIDGYSCTLISSSSTNAPPEAPKMQQDEPKLLGPLELSAQASTSSPPPQQLAQSSGQFKQLAPSDAPERNLHNEQRRSGGDLRRLNFLNEFVGADRSLAGSESWRAAYRLHEANGGSSESLDDDDDEDFEDDGEDDELADYGDDDDDDQSTFKVSTTGQIGLQQPTRMSIAKLTRDNNGRRRFDWRKAAQMSADKRTKKRRSSEFAHRRLLTARHRLSTTTEESAVVDGKLAMQFRDSYTELPIELRLVIDQATSSEAPPSQSRAPENDRKIATRAEQDMSVLLENGPRRWVLRDRANTQSGLEDETTDCSDNNKPNEPQKNNNNDSDFGGEEEIAQDEQEQSGPARMQLEQEQPRATDFKEEPEIDGSESSSSSSFDVQGKQILIDGDDEAPVIDNEMISEDNKVQTPSSDSWRQADEAEHQAYEILEAAPSESLDANKLLKLVTGDSDAPEDSHQDLQSQRWPDELIRLRSENDKLVGQLSESLHQSAANTRQENLADKENKPSIGQDINLLERLLTKSNALSLPVVDSWQQHHHHKAPEQPQSASIDASSSLGPRHEDPSSLAGWPLDRLSDALLARADNRHHKWIHSRSDNRVEQVAAREETGQDDDDAEVSWSSDKSSEQESPIDSATFNESESEPEWELSQPELSLSSESQATRNQDSPDTQTSDDHDELSSELFDDQLPSCEWLYSKQDDEQQQQQRDDKIARLRSERNFYSPYENCAQLPECEWAGRCVVDWIYSRSTTNHHKSPPSRSYVNNRLVSAEAGAWKKLRRARCQCPLGRGGLLCEKLEQPNIPSFSGVSYVALPMVQASSIRNLSIMFKPTRQAASMEDAHQWNNKWASLANEQQDFEEELDEERGENRLPVGATHKYLLSSSHFVLLCDDMNRIELRYKQPNVDISRLRHLAHASGSSRRQNVIRVMGSRDVRMNQWNRLIVTDNASSLSPISSNADHNHSTASSINEIILVLPEPIQLLHNNTREGAASELFVAGVPSSRTSNRDIVAGELGADEEQLGFDDNNLIAKDFGEMITGFTGCVRQVSINQQAYRLKSDLQGDILDAYDIRECCKLNDLGIA